MYTYKELFVDKIYGELMEFKKLDDTDIDDVLKINISLTNRCNQQCSYCIADTPNDINKYDIKKEYIKYFFYHMKKNNILDKFRVNLLGGEPTLYKDINYILDSVLNNYPNTKTKLITNGTATTDYYENIMNNYHSRLDISYHPKFANDNHFIDLIDMFKKNNYDNYRIYILLEYDYYNKIINFINMLANTYESCNTSYILLAGVDYNNTKYKIFNDLINKNNILNIELYRLTFKNKEILLHYKDISFFNVNNNIFKGMKCTIFNNQWYIWDNNIKSMCNISKTYSLLPNGINDFILDYNNYKTGILCDRDKCDCDCLIEGYKYK